MQKEAKHFKLKETSCT